LGREGHAERDQKEEVRSFHAVDWLGGFFACRKSIRLCRCAVSFSRLAGQIKRRGLASVSLPVSL
jgi:hypothetical protein